ncbi:hypothetical protein ASPWEDRAFT_169867 [Aspergillus wentii DTO 134E9]|uniref:Uncharacterized protein n=1 Tax=Aspergillus wentii DTO 134E9 TaxID=1073089 RepID=A0A1L9RND1_ASPWE|nr:uncharacterized protein ASPWEDRAFT_169867 [Aspergillus wentii DTO 134E9]KAI9926001.1 hypothetical protein MW887_004460 [Aspergillus wentii]OJJ36338.1 hypothetical protein ASPWEDRAFT_169867 [Aspergillus wentii DTO 134E9]
MHFRILLALFAFTSLSVAEASPDEGDLDKRQFSPPGCFCCTGYVVPNIAGTRCGKDHDTCDSRDRLCCSKGAIVWPKIDSSNSSSVACRG